MFFNTLLCNEVLWYMPVIECLLRTMILRDFFVIFFINLLNSLMCTFCVKMFMLDEFRRKRLIISTKCQCITNNLENTVGWLISISVLIYGSQKTMLGTTTLKRGDSSGLYMIWWTEKANVFAAIIEKHLSFSL